MAHDEDDDDIADLVDAAQALIEGEADVRSGPQTVEVAFARFPAGPVLLPVGPALAEGEPVAVTYADAAGLDRVLDPGAYAVVPARTALYPLAGRPWPTALAARPDAVRVVVVVVHDQQPLIRQAARLLIGAWYESRGDGRDPAPPAALGIPAGAQRLLDQLRPAGYR